MIYWKILPGMSEKPFLMWLMKFDNIPFTQARHMIVDIPVYSCGRTNVYVDDFINVGSYIDNSLERITKAPITVILLVFRTYIHLHMICSINYHHVLLYI